MSSPRYLLAALLSLAFVATLATPVAAAQVPCDPAIEICDSFDDLPPLDEPFPEDPFFCDPYLDPTCAPEFIEDPFFCDPYLDPTCAPEFVEDPFFDAVVVGGPGDPLFCDPYIDPTCLGEPPADFAEYCATVPDPICDLPEFQPEPAAPQALAFTDPPPQAAAVATRSDTTDDLPPTEVPAEDVPVIAANRLLFVVDALAELGAFQRTPDPTLTSALRQVREDVPADGLTEEGYRDEVERFAADLPLYIAQLEGAGVAVSPSLRALEDVLTPEAIDSLNNGDTALFEAAQLFSAIADLSVRGGTGPEAGRDLEADITEVLGISVLYAAPAEPVVASTTTAAPTTTTTTTTVVATTEAPVVAAAPAPAEPPAESTGSTTGLWIGICTAIALAAAALIALLRRRSTASTVDTGNGNEIVSVDDLLDASRRMTASLDSAEIVAIALGETRRLIDAEGGIVVMRNGENLETVGSEPDHFFQPELAHEGSLRRVVETGRSVAMIATDEPVLVEVPVAMAAVSIVIDGTVAGSIMVVRIPSRPFDRQELEALEMLAPLVGSALNAAAAHDTATALVDVEPMTGLKNRRRLDRDMAELTDDDQVAYVMVDVDHFKNFNDVNGHAAGDEALRQVANALSDSVRPGDVVYRYGGEEFCILLPATTTDDAVTVAERARATVEALDIPGGENQPSGRVTISVGVADTSDQPLDDLIERADGALYEAKHGGRNQVRTAG